MGRASLAMSAVLAALALSSCALPSVSAPSPSSSTSAGPASVTPSPSSPAVPSATQSAPPSEAPIPVESPVAVRSGTLPSFGQLSATVSAEVYPVRRSGETAVVNIHLTSDNRFRLGRALSDRDREVADRELASVDGVRLIDPGGKKAYLPATVGDGQCLCSPSGEAADDLVRSVWVSVVFAAPAASVRHVDVVIPVFGTVSHVPVV